MRVAVIAPFAICPSQDSGGWQLRNHVFLMCLIQAGVTVDLVYAIRGPFDTNMSQWSRDVPGVASVRFVSLPETGSNRARLATAARAISRRPGPENWEQELLDLVASRQPDVVVGLLAEDPSIGRLPLTQWPSVLVAEEDLCGSYAGKGRLGSWIRTGRVGRSLRQARWPEPSVATAISEREAAWVSSTFPGIPCLVLPHFVDDAYWASGQRDTAPPCDVFCIGNFQEPRNALGLLDFLPSTGSSSDGPSISVACSRSPHEVLSPFWSGSRRHLGAVEDPRPFYYAATACLVPAKHVSGVKTQVLQGWATGCPVLCTPQAAESVGATTERDVLIVSDAADLAESVGRLAADPDLRERLAANGRQVLTANYSAALAQERFLAAVRLAGGRLD